MPEDSHCGAVLIVDAVKQKISRLATRQTGPRSNFLIELCFSSFDEKYGGSDLTLFSLVLIAGIECRAGELNEKTGRLELDEALNRSGAVQQIRQVIDILRMSFANIRVSITASMFFDNPRGFKPDKGPIDVDMHLGLSN